MRGRPSLGRRACTACHGRRQRLRGSIGGAIPPPAPPERHHETLRPHTPCNRRRRGRHPRRVRALRGHARHVRGGGASAEAFHERVAGVLAGYPYLMAEQDGCVVACCLTRTPRPSGRPTPWNAELSVYLAPGAQGAGLGSALYGALIELVRLQGMKCAYARVTLPNAASERLHEAFGFRLMGIQRNAGYTCGAWRDVAWLSCPWRPSTPHPRRPSPSPPCCVATPPPWTACWTARTPRPPRSVSAPRNPPCSPSACSRSSTS